MPMGGAAEGGYGAAEGGPRIDPNGVGLSRKVSTSRALRHLPDSDVGGPSALAVGTLRDVKKT